MFLHIGNDVYIPEKDIIAICNLDTASVSKNTQLYLKKCEEKKIIEPICDDIPKTFILLKKNGKDKIYLTNISSSTLQKRSLMSLEQQDL